jgi:hypothetical protein
LWFLIWFCELYCYSFSIPKKHVVLYFYKTGYASAYVSDFFSSQMLRHFQILDMQIPSINILQYTSQVLGVILALLDDLDELVQLTAVSCLLKVNSLLCMLAFHRTISVPCNLDSFVLHFLLTCRYLSHHPMMQQWNPFCLIFLYDSAIFKCVPLLFEILIKKIVVLVLDISIVITMSFFS